jgi:hypothetical protein
MGGVRQHLTLKIGMDAHRVHGTQKCQKMSVLGLILPFVVFGFPSMTDVGSSCRCQPLGVRPQVIPAWKMASMMTS